MSVVAAVKDLLDLFQAAGFGAEWQDRAGGCYSIVLVFGEGTEYPFGRTEIVVHDREDVFASADLISDDDVYGFFARAYQLDREGVPDQDDDSEGWIYATPDDGVCISQADDGDTIVQLGPEVDEVFAAVLNFIGSTEGRKYLKLDEPVK